ncbi:MAG TPA: hypothetical protein PKN14_04125 [Bacteroidia bacterium]|nr:lactate utilization protein [Bacteroidia bacterium]HNR48413.1 hypothetical protein [Bacteroidia bacterium]HNT82286.1 hypothetical protein [Bacteroidia bacterium]
MLKEVDFKKATSEVLNEGKTRQRFEQALQKQNQRKKNYDALFSDYDLASKRAAYIRWKAIESLDKLLIAFEANCIKSGIKVLWALDSEQALQEINSVAQKHNLSHIDIQSRLQEELNLPLSEIGYGKKLSVRDVAFITAEPSGIICRDTADNLIQESACNDVVLYIAPIDSMLTSPHDAEVLLGILSAGPDDQNIKNNLRIITSANESNGAVYVLLVDNGRSSLLENIKLRQLLRCINSGACNESSAVVHSIGFTGGNRQEYGPLLYAKAPAIGGYRDFGHYAYNTPLCGQCNVVCPVRIDFTDIFLEHRHVMVQQKLRPQKERLFYMVWKKTMLKREFMNWKAVNPMRYSIETLFLKSKTGIRKLPEASHVSFNQQWRERMGMK